ncbi:MAG: UDP-glucose 4-epimerase GalE [bacterium]
MTPKKETILVLGGAGYIGSHTAYLLAQQKYHVIIIDKLIHKQTFPHQWAKFIQADFADTNVLAHIFSTYNISTVMHFAAFIEVGESVKRPCDFYENNVQKVLILLESMLQHNIKNFIFSSSCAVYGEPQKLPLEETHPTNPTSPYGKNKLIVEFALQDYALAYDFKFVSLRYFNAAGAMPEQNLGEQHNPETHIIPLLLRAIISEKIFTIFGTDYNTPDGTCMRDYVHVIDIAHAHIAALNYLKNGNQSGVFNLGSGHGYTVAQVIQAAEKICSKKAHIVHRKRRPGDVAILQADANKAQKILNWHTKHSTLEAMLTSALAWEKKSQINNRY